MTALATLRTTLSRPLAAAVLAFALWGVSAALSHVQTAHAQTAHAVLREQVTVNGDLVTLGDLFENAGPAAKVAVFRSPDLGTQGVVATQRIAAAAERHGLAWSNPSEIEQVVVVRPSRLVTVDEIGLLLRDRIAAELGVEDPAAIEVDLPRGTKPVHIDPKTVEPLVVKRLYLDDRSGNFQAVVGLQEPARDTPDQNYQGRAVETVEVAVPLRPVARGVIVAAEDITTARVPRSQLPSDAVIDRAGLIGMAAKRHLAAGRPVRHADVGRPTLVERNTVVSIVFRVPGLTLKSMGRALDDGAMGDSVPVLNTQSRRTVYAQVAGPGEVTVGADASPRPATAPKSAASAAGSRYLVR